MPLQVAHRKRLPITLQEKGDCSIDEIKVLLVSNYLVVREGLRTMLATAKDIEVVGEASYGLEVLHKVNEFQPAVVLIDAQMPNLDGLWATKRIKSKHPSTKIIVLTSHDGTVAITDAVRAGAVGYLLKDTSRELLVHAVRAANCGVMVTNDSLLRESILNITGSFGNNADKPAKSKPEDTVVLNQLTSRERDVLHLLVFGRSNRQIAEELYLSEDTTTKYTRTLMMKLGVSNRTQAAVKGICAGIADNLSTEMRW